MLPTNTFNPEQIMKTLSAMQAELRILKLQVSEQAKTIRTQNETIQEQAKKILGLGNTVSGCEVRVEALANKYSLISIKLDQDHDEQVVAANILEDGVTAVLLAIGDLQKHHGKSTARIAAIENCLEAFGEEDSKEESEFTSPKFNSNPVSLGNFSGPHKDNHFSESVLQVTEVRDPFVPPVVYKHEAEEMKPEDLKKRRKVVTDASPLSPTVRNTIFNGTVGKSPSVGRAVNEVVNEDETF